MTYLGKPPSSAASFGLALAGGILLLATGATTLAGSYGLRNHGSTFSRRAPGPKAGRLERSGGRPGERTSASPALRGGRVSPSVRRGGRRSRSLSAERDGAGEKVDPWFLKPYEPAKATPVAAVNTPAAAKPKQKLAALLGGLSK